MQVGLLRLRKCSGPAKDRQPSLMGRVSLVRELHVYGTAVAVHARDSSKLQHQARLLLFRAALVPCCRC